MTVQIGTLWQFSKQINKLLFQVSVQVYFFGKTEGERKAFLGGRKGAAAWNKGQLVVIRDKKSLSFCEIRNNRAPSLMFIRPPYKWVLQGMIDLWIDCRICQKNPVVNKGKF